MRVLRDMSLRSKLLGMAGILIALCAVGGVLAIANLSSSSNLGTDLYQNATVPIIHLQSVETNLGNIDTDLLKSFSARAGAAQYAQAFQTDSAALQRDLAAYHSTSLSAGEQAAYNQFVSDLSQYMATGNQVLTLAQKGTPAAVQAANALYFAKASSQNGALDQALGQLVKINDTQAATNAQSIKSNESSSAMTTILILVFSVLAGGLIAWFVSAAIRRSVVTIKERLELVKTKGVERLTGGLQAFAAGDLTQEFEITSTEVTDFAADELGQIQRDVEGVRDAIVEGLEAYNATRAKLAALLGEVSGSAGQVSAASQEMAATSQQSGEATGEIASAVTGIAEGAERQVQVVERARAAAEEVGRAVTEAADNAQHTAEMAHDASTVAQQGVDAAEQATEAMRSVRDSSSAVSEAIRELASKSDQIGQIVQTITGIAEQTNLLALNAAIEAARAGEQGRGFAVVAEEVRKLAEESQHAAHEISGLIAAIQSDTSHAVEVVEDGANRTTQGASVVEQTREAFLQIGSAVEEMTGRIEQIAAASQQIAASAQSMQDSIQEVAAVAQESSASTEEVSASTEETSASAEQIAASAQELSGNAEALNRLVAQFKVTG
ncbi:MAG TPA: methyl-accepting chemotaxis protein [Solirubrobacteraceae bacterium]|nr:methyl-accepting chemotaxis protein [Solirubrobacteraceae bacterium]